MTRETAAFRSAAAACLVATLGIVGAAAGQEISAEAIRERQSLDQAAGLAQAGRADEAMRVLEDLLREQPGSLSALVLLERTAEGTGDPGRALPWVEAAVRNDRTGLPAARQLWIRVLEAAGLGDSALSAATRWTRDEPLEPSSYLALSGLRVRTGDRAGSVAALEQGRMTIGSNRLFVQELALLHTESGLWEEAAVEWRTMLGWGAPGVETVQRHIVSLDASRSAAVSALRVEIAGPEATILERRGGTELALLLGEFEWARDVAASLVDDLPEPGGQEILRDFVTRAQNSGDPAGAAWAAESLAGRSDTRDGVLYWLAVSADLAFEAGDIASARAAFERLIGEAQPGSDLFGVAVRRLHDLWVEEDPDRAEELLEEHRNLYPEERLASVEMAVRSAQVWMRRGELGRARSSLALASPADAEQAALQAGAMGRLEILAGHPEAARAHLELAASVPVGRPGARVDALELLVLVEEADPGGLVDMASAISSTAASGNADLLFGSVSRWSSEGTPGGERMASFVAQQLEASGQPAAARRVRIGIVQSWPGSPAAPKALLELARADARDEPARAEAWLERLIVEYPESALAPVARQFLTELRDAGGVPSA
jgi:predicted Zn-dependent protease